MRRPRQDARRGPWGLHNWDESRPLKPCTLHAGHPRLYLCRSSTQRAASQRRSVPRPSHSSWSRPDWDAVVPAWFQARPDRTDRRAQQPLAKRARRVPRRGLWRARSCSVLAQSHSPPVHHLYLCTSWDPACISSAHRASKGSKGESTWTFRVCPWTLRAPRPCPFEPCRPCRLRPVPFRQRPLANGQHQRRSMLPAAIVRPFLLRLDWSGRVRCLRRCTQCCRLHAARRTLRVARHEPPRLFPLIPTYPCTLDTRTFLSTKKFLPCWYLVLGRARQAPSPDHPPPSSHHPRPRVQILVPFTLILHLRSALLTFRRPFPRCTDGLAWLAWSLHAPTNPAHPAQRSP